MKIRSQRNIRTYAQAFTRAAAKIVRVQPVKYDPPIVIKKVSHVRRKV